MENNSVNGVNGEISAAGSGEVEYATVVKHVADTDNTTANDTDNKNPELDAESGVQQTEDVNDYEDKTAADGDAGEKSEDSVNADDFAAVADKAEPDEAEAAGHKPDEPPEEEVRFSELQHIEADYTEIAEVQDTAEHASKADEDVPPPPPPDSEPPSEDPPSYNDVQNDDEQAHEPEREPSPEPECEPSPVPVVSKPQHNFHPRKCHIRKWPDFQGYGFNLHAEKDKKGQYIGLVDANSPAEDADLRKGDRIIEVNGDNIEDVPHAQVIQKIKAGGDETILLVVDPEADEFYKNNGIRVTADLPEVIANETRRKDSTPDVTTTQAKTYIPRECHIIKWPDFPGYGFNLHAEKERGTQYIGKIDPNSPAEDAGLCEHDRIIEVNGVNVENETHQQVIARIKAGGDETRLLVVDKEADAHYKSKGITVTSKMPEVKFLQTTRRSPRGSAVTNGDSKPAANSAPVKQSQPTKEPAKSDPAQANGGDLLSMNLSAKEMRERLASKKKNDPKMKANMDFKSKFEIFQKM